MVKHSFTCFVAPRRGLFFEHGADPPQPNDVAALFETAADRARFNAMLQERTNVISRPPRKCPCGSGIPVSECHATSQPYPLEYVCVCGSGKTYEKCCFYRKSFVAEKWNSNTNQIVHDFEHSATQIYEKAAGISNEVRQALASATGITLDQDSLNPPTYTLDMWRKFSEELVKDSGLIDPAFAYALVRSDFLPRPRARKRSRELCEGDQAQWNALVDEYIETQSDKRSRYDIERAAKIGVWHGALY
ncbi:hypothetical protein R3P38DRAFT_2773413 [Favolaschia claudopus]|uniref:Uncharacterized protein n=1 Tax=Favolaschia claudopus TaxID=2862362 RepID=A0AAW0C4T1_9AGAR